MAKLRGVLTEQWQDWVPIGQNGKIEIRISHSGRNDKTQNIPWLKQISETYLGK
jgi:hypothetical protein